MIRIRNVSPRISKTVGFSPLKPRSREIRDPGVFSCAHPEPHALARNYRQSPQRVAFRRVLSLPGRVPARRDIPFRSPRVRPEVSGLRRAFFVRVMAREQNGCRVMGHRVITRESFEIADLRVMVRGPNLTDQNHDASQLLSLR